jgi:hypothetical protein
MMAFPVSIVVGHPGHVTILLCRACGSCAVAAAQHLRFRRSVLPDDDEDPIEEELRRTGLQ